MQYCGRIILELLSESIWNNFKDLQNIVKAIIVLTLKRGFQDYLHKYDLNV